MKDEKWIEDFLLLSERGQVRVSESIINYLRQNERMYSEEEYDQERSKRVRELFEELVKSRENKQINNDLVALLEKYEKLTPEYRKIVAESIIEVVDSYLNHQIHEENKNKCEQEGHVYSDWEYVKVTGISNGFIDHQWVEGMPYEKNEWHRTCKRCGYVEVVEYEPEEVRIAREEQERKAEIKRLRKELKKLQGK
jgi:hypothetical protein